MYKTVFEELAIHVFVVVSIGHQDESALLLVDHEIIVANCPDNEIYAQRTPELKGKRINELQSVILNSDIPKEVETTYRELLDKSPLHQESVKLWTLDTEEAISKLTTLTKPIKT